MRATLRALALAAVAAGLAAPASQAQSAGAPGVGDSYYPFAGKAPRSGRLEIIPSANRRLPPRAESFHRYWSNDAPPVPAQTEYPAVVPPVILAPRVRGLN